MCCKIGVEKARQYFEHPSQQLHGITPDNLPDEPFEYWADGPVCGVFHPTFWPGVWMGHYAVKPSGWGKADQPALRILWAFWNKVEPERIIGWTPETNRRALAFAKRLGFVEDGRMMLKDETIVMQGWTKWA